MTHAAMTPRARRRDARSAPVRARARAALAMAILGIAAVAPPPAAGVAVERELAVMGTALRMRIEAAYGVPVTPVIGHAEVAGTKGQ